MYALVPGSGMTGEEEISDRSSVESRSMLDVQFVHQVRTRSHFIVTRMLKAINNTLDLFGQQIGDSYSRYFTTYGMYFIQTKKQI